MTTITEQPRPLTLDEGDEPATVDELLDIIGRACKVIEHARFGRDLDDWRIPNLCGTLEALLAEPTRRMARVAATYLATAVAS